MSSQNNSPAQETTDSVRDALQEGMRLINVAFGELVVGASKHCPSAERYSFETNFYAPARVWLKAASEALASTHAEGGTISACASTTDDLLRLAEAIDEARDNFLTNNFPSASARKRLEEVLWNDKGVFAPALRELAARRSPLQEIVDGFINPYDGGVFEVGEVPSLDVLRQRLGAAR